MNNTGQGILQLSKFKHWLMHILVLLTFCLTHTVIAETVATETPTHKKNTPDHHVFIIYSPDNILHSNIIQKLSEKLQLKRSDMVISTVTPEEQIKTVNNNTDIIIGIGSAGMKNADTHYPKTKKLFISTDPNKYRLDTNKNKYDAILYMTQSYCRQIQFIKKINKNWKKISILNSQKKPVNSAEIQTCANKLGIKIVTVNITDEDNLTNKIKTALSRSDVLLALPDSNIYNKKTVKNILLTSYRLRKPVIAFSKNFVDAGALAAIYSSTEQIAQSASTIIKQYFKSGEQFKKSINYPQAFNVSFNKQVFRALDLTMPDPEQIRQDLEYQETNNPAGWQ
jgi:ABC-type uncharacterized transport system substrate-binding protein